jgi:predicted nucleic acid-binding Zn ribbon protein
LKTSGVIDEDDVVKSERMKVMMNRKRRRHFWKNAR